MASQDLLPLPLRPCVICFLLLMFGMSNDKFKSGVSCFDTQYPTCSVTEAPHLPPFTHYILALQWPPSVCKTVRCRTDKPVPKKFTIHGLWPWPITTKPSCSDEKFDYIQLMRANLHKLLDDAWPSLLENKGQQAFLTHEWVKHGTCSGLTQTEYFKTALDLYKSDDVSNVYSKLDAIFGPDPNKKCYPSDILKAYDNKRKLKIKIKCIKEKGSTEEMIGEIHFQVNKITKTVENITGSPTTGCTRNTQVSFPKEYKKPKFK